MTTMKGFRMDEDNNSIKITCSNVSNYNALKEYLRSIKVNTKESIPDVLHINNKNISITINSYEGIVLVVVEEDKDKNKDYYLFDEDVKVLKIMENDTKIIFTNGNKVITNDSLNDENNTSLLVHFLNYLTNLQSLIPFNLESLILCNSLRIYNHENSTIITEDSEIILAQPNFYKKDIKKMRLNIILKKGLRVVGSLECYLNEEGISNFSYRGNLAFNIYHEYANMGYERKSLKVLKNYIDNSNELINKEIFIAGTKEDEPFISSLSTSCGGRLEYDGLVPKSDPLNYMGKVKSVKIYRIG